MATRKQTRHVAFALACAIFLLTACTVDPPVAPEVAQVDVTFALQSPTAMNGKITIQEAYLKLDHIEVAGVLGGTPNTAITHPIPEEDPPFKLSNADSTDVSLTLTSRNYDQLGLRLALANNDYELIFVSDATPAETPTPNPPDVPPNVPSNTGGEQEGSNGNTGGSPNGGDNTDSDTDTDNDNVSNDDSNNNGSGEVPDTDQAPGQDDNTPDQGDNSQEEHDDNDESNNEGAPGDKHNGGGDKPGNHDPKQGDGKDKDGGKEKDDKEKKDKKDKGKEDKKDKNDKDRKDKSDKKNADDKGGNKDKGKSNDKGKGDDKGKGHQHDGGEHHDKHNHDGGGDHHGPGSDHDDDDGRRAAGTIDDAVDLDNFFQCAKPGLIVFGTYQNNGKVLSLIFVAPDLENLSVTATQNDATAIRLAARNSARLSMDPTKWFDSLSPADIEGGTLQTYGQQTILFIHPAYNEALYQSIVSHIEDSVSLTISSPTDGDF